MGQVKRAVAVVVLFCFVGCASIVGKLQYPVAITSTPDDATILIKDERNNQIFSGKTPTTVTLVSGESYFHSKAYTVEFSKPGYQTQTAKIKTTLSGWYIGNLIFGGLIGLLIVDPMTGKMYKIPQKDLNMNLNGNSAAQSEGFTTLKIVSISEISPELREKLVRIK